MIAPPPPWCERFAPAGGLRACPRGQLQCAGSAVRAHWGARAHSSSWRTAPRRALGVRGERRLDADAPVRRFGRRRWALRSTQPECALARARPAPPRCVGERSALYRRRTRAPAAARTPRHDARGARWSALRVPRARVRPAQQRWAKRALPAVQMARGCPAAHWQRYAEERDSAAFAERDSAAEERDSAALTPPPPPPCSLGMPGLGARSALLTGSAVPTWPTASAPVCPTPPRGAVGAVRAASQAAHGRARYPEACVRVHAASYSAQGALFAHTGGHTRIPGAPLEPLEEGGRGLEEGGRGDKLK